MVAASSLSGTLDDRIRRFLADSHPNRPDSLALDQISAPQIHQVTFSPLREVRDSFLANYLVPHDVSIRKRNQAWRYAPYIRVIVPLFSNPGAVQVRIDFSVPRWVSYAEQTQHGLRERRSVKRPSIPRDFFDVESTEGPGLKRANLRSEIGSAVRPIGLSLGHYTWEGKLDLGTSNDFTIEIPEFREVLREESRQNAEVESNAARPTGAAVLLHRSPPRTVRVTARLSSESNGNPPTLEIDVTNVTHVSEKEAAAATYWGEKTIVFPEVRIAFDRDITFPTQDDSQRLVAEEAGEARRAFLTEIQQNAPRGVNCVVTIPPGSSKLLIAAMTAVHDSVLIRPVPGPPISELGDEEGLASHLDCLSEEELMKLKASGRIATLAGVIESIHRSFPEITHLHWFQWLAIQRQVQLLLNAKVAGSCHLVKAPTGTGKTLVFMANSLLYYLWTGNRAVLAFPTRILNEDMYRRLTILLHNSRQVFPKSNITGGILIGTRDPLYAAVARPNVGQRMVQFEVCPNCHRSKSVFAQNFGKRIIGVCQNSDLSSRPVSM
ncbi:MAG: DEAD/DEAH box helicase [Thermoplasmata archaeon]